MATDLTALRAEAEDIARALPRIRVKVAASEATHVGSAGRRRAGAGEHFWQYRRHMPEDDSKQIDWRRSARGDTLFVRETELETARTFLFWIDPHPGFDWRGETSTPTKASRAKVACLATGALLAREGERIGVLGGRPAGFGPRSIDRLAEDFEQTSEAFPPSPKRTGAAIIASDFYDPIDTWHDRLRTLAARCPVGILFVVSDPLEANFPFAGRVRLSRPGTVLERLLGRAEAIRAAYQERFAEHRTELSQLAAAFGWRVLFHQTDTSALTGAGKLVHLIESLEAVG